MLSLMLERRNVYHLPRIVDPRIHPRIASRFRDSSIIIFNMDDESGILILGFFNSGILIPGFFNSGIF